jgi:hypothetical protein
MFVDNGVLLYIQKMYDWQKTIQIVTAVHVAIQTSMTHLLYELRYFSTDENTTYSITSVH